MTGLAASPIINDINNINSSINTIINNTNTINSDVNTIKNNINSINNDISSLQNNKADKYYNYQKIGLISDNDNLNNYRTIGSYTMTTAVGATTLSNLPSGASAGTLHVINVLGDTKTLTGKTGQWEYFMQIYIDYMSKIFIRKIHNNNGSISYGDWSQL